MKEEKKHEERMTDKIKNNYLLFIKNAITIVHNYIIQNLYHIRMKNK